MKFIVKTNKIIFLLILYQIIETIQFKTQSTKYIQNVNKTGVHKKTTIANYLLRDASEASNFENLLKSNLKFQFNENEYNSYGQKYYANKEEKVKCLFKRIKEQIFWWSHPNGSLDPSHLKDKRSAYYLDLSFMNISTEDIILRETNNYIAILETPTVVAFSLAGNKLQTVPFEPLNLMRRSLLYLNLRGNNFIRSKSRNYSAWANFPSFFKLKSLDLGNCNINYLHNEIFKNFTNLENLILSDNSIAELSSGIFRYLSNLKYLDISNTDVFQPSSEISPSNRNYIELLNKRSLQIAEIVFKQLKNLELLDLSYTKISKQNAKYKSNYGKTLQYFSLCFAHIPVFSKRRIYSALPAVKPVNISANPYAAYNLNNHSFDGLQETLTYLWFKELDLKRLLWMENLNSSIHNLRLMKNFTELDKNHFVTYCQHFELEKLEDCKFKKIVSQTEIASNSTIYIVAGCVALAILILLLIFIKLKTNWFSKIPKKLSTFYADEKNEFGAFKYDVFVSYSDSDRDWILMELLPNIETDKTISICLHERDFQVGLTIWENIINSMEKSKSLLLVISSNFIRSNWCQFEMHFAQKRLFERNKNKLVLILLEEIPLNERPKVLQHLMEIRTYIKWPTICTLQNINNEKELFWKRIRTSLQCE